MTAARPWCSMWWQTIPSVSRFSITTARNGRCARRNAGFFAVNRWSITRAKSKNIMKTFTLLHVLISLAGIFSGFVVLFGLVAGKQRDGWTKFFLATTVATSVTGFFFPFHGLTPAIVVGIISLAALAVALFARYARHLAGAWCKTYVFSAVLALYLNVFVLIAQSFLKIPALKEIAPTQNDPPFKFTQLVVLVAFITLGIVAASRFRGEPVSPILEAKG